MRREWSSWIKTRQWAEFEKLAKLDPSQGLADTMAELELGFPDKADRRALRKVLYLLAQAGFEPRELEEFDEEIEAPTAPFEVAFMVSPDGLGESIITYGNEVRGRVNWLVAHLNPRTGVSRAVEDTTTLDEAQTKLVRFQHMTPAPYISAAIPADFALQRIAKAVDASRTVPPVMAYWRAVLPKDLSNSHPADAVHRSQQTEDKFDILLQTSETMHHWRLELGSLAPLMIELQGSDAAKEPSEEDGKERWQSIIESARRELFTGEVTYDHHQRLLDLGYLMHLKQMPDAEIVLALADDLKLLGSDSKYARHIVSKSLLLYMRTLKARNEEEKARVSESEGSS